MIFDILFVVFVFLSVWFGAINFAKLVGKQPISATNFIIMAVGFTGVITRLLSVW